jgi:hypothetical protein
MMKLFAKSLIAGALIMLTVPAAAMAYDGCGYGYRPGAYSYRDIGRDRHNLRYEERDIARDRYRLNQDLAYGNWRAARAQQADINRDINNIRRDRFDLNRDYQRFGY